MAIVRREAIEFRQPKKDVWLRLFRMFRGIESNDTPYRSKIISTYLWSAVQSWISVLEPIFFASHPIFDLKTPRDEDDERNRLLEALLTQQVQYQSNFRRAWTRILLEALVFGSSYPWTYFKSRTKPVWAGYTPIRGPDGFPVRDPVDGTTMVREDVRQLRVYHAPYVEPVDLWDSFIHPDGRRGFSRRMVTGYELRQEAGNLYRKDRVERMLKAGARWLQGKRSGENYSFGDDNQVIDNELAQEAGTEAGKRFEYSLLGYQKDLDAMKFPILHYDDGDFSGSYALNRDGRLYELRFFEGSSPDGEGNRLALTPYTSPQEVVGVSVAETTYGLLEAHTRFMQLAIDGASLTVHPQWTVSRTYDQEIGEVHTGPGVINMVPTMGNEPMENHLKPEHMPTGWDRAMVFQQFLEDDLNDAWAQDDFTKGRFSSGRKTAREVSEVLQFAQARLELLADRIADQFGRPLGRKWMCMNAIHMNEQDMVDVLGVQAVGVQMPDVEIILRTMQVMFKGSVLASNSTSRLTQMANLANSYFQALPFLQFPHVQSFMRKWFELAGLEGITKDFPPVDPNAATRLEQIMMEKGMADLAGGGGPIQPSSPTDVTGAFRGAGGAEAPPPPVNAPSAAPAAGGF
jgi:hypothetical protein